MFKNVFKKLRSDRGDGSLVALIIVLPLLVGLLFTIFDISSYFANRAYMQTVTQNGARTVAIMGGNGTSNRSTPLEARYGLTKAETCDLVNVNLRAGEAKKASSSAIECNMILDLQNAKGLINVSVQKVDCTPTSSNAIGERVSCEIGWTYGGTPGSGMSILKLGQTNLTAGSAESEVDLDGALTTRK